MALTVNWTTEAEETYEKIILYLKENWTEREVQNFANRVERLIANISEYPYIFKASSSKKIRIAVIGKQNSLIYLIHKDEIYLLHFWDNRQDPKKNKY